MSEKLKYIKLGEIPYLYSIDKATLVIGEINHKYTTCPQDCELGDFIGDIDSIIEKTKKCIITGKKPPSAEVLKIIIQQLPFLPKFDDSLSSKEKIQYKITKVNKKAKLTDEIAQKYETIYIRYLDLVQFLHFIVIDKPTNTQMYSTKLTFNDIPPHLYNEVLDAIKSHQKLKYSNPEADDSQINEIAFGKEYIYMFEGLIVRICLITRGELSENGKDDFNSFCTDFEGIYQQDLVGWDGEILEFSEIDQLFEKYFEFDLNYPINLKTIFNTYSEYTDFDYFVISKIPKVAIEIGKTSKIFPYSILRYFVSNAIIGESAQEVGNLLNSLKKIGRNNPL
jgi:hypothetical protein